MHHKKIFGNTNYILLILFLFACKKMVDIGPPKTQLVSSSVFTSDATATAAITGIYVQMTMDAGLNTFPSGSLSFFGGVAADELNYLGNNTPYNEINSNSITVTNGEIDNFWNSAYQYIYGANAALEGLNGSSGLSDSVKKQLTGEALFIRAFSNFYLVNYFGDIPLVVSTNYQISAVAARSSTVLIYQQITNDLVQAQTLLAHDYSYSEGERVRPNYWAATALLSRVYLYTGNWADAESLATLVIDNSSDFILASDPTNVFEKNGSESIWQLLPVSPGYNYRVQDAIWFIPAADEVPNTAMTSELLNDFESGDLRRTAWIDSTVIDTSIYYYPFKYKVKDQLNTTEYYTLLRLGEQYLIRSEARAQQNKPDEAIGDVNIIRTRAGLPSLPMGLSQADCLTAIQQERRVEMFCECGQRWFDLQRTKTADEILSTLKPSWKSTDILFPIPQTERQKDPNLTQNPGY